MKNSRTVMVRLSALYASQEQVKSAKNFLDICREI